MTPPRSDPLLSTEKRLRSAGVDADTRLALVVEPDPAGAVLILAAGRIGGSISVLHPRWAGAEMAWALDQLEPHHVVVGPGVVLPDGLRGGLPHGEPPLRWSHPARDRWLEPTDTGWDPVKPSVGSREEPPGGESEWIVWTSGTGGRSRGIVLPYRALRHSARAAGSRLGLKARDRWICSLYPSHVGGLALILRAGVLGSALCLPGPFDPEAFNHQVDRGEVSHASLVPTQLLQVLEERGDRPFPSRFRALLLGGAAAPPSLLERAFAAGVPVALTYGMTEAASQVATAPPDLVRRKPDGVGPPLEGIEVRAGSEADGPSEILVRGPTLARGIWEKPGRDPAPLTDPEGWYRTGDLGIVDAEGHLRVTGRLAERIISGGVNVDPGEVEAALAGQPGVGEVAVVGVPDPRWGERVVAVVLPADPAHPPTREDLLAHVRLRLSSAKRPREVHLVDSLPRTATGKVDRRRLAEGLGGGG